MKGQGPENLLQLLAGTFNKSGPAGSPPPVSPRDDVPRLGGLNCAHLGGADALWPGQGLGRLA